MVYFVHVVLRGEQSPGGNQFQVGCLFHDPACPSKLSALKHPHVAEKLFFLAKWTNESKPKLAHTHGRVSDAPATPGRL